MHANVKKSVRFFVITVLVMTTLGLGAQPLLAQGTTTTQGPAVQEEDWRFAVGLYGWLLNVHGDLHSPTGTDHDFTVPFSDILSDTKAFLEAVGEVGWGKWFLVFDGTWATLEGQSAGTVFDLDVELKMEIYDLHLGYNIYRKVKLEQSRPGDPWAHVSAVDFMLGARYFGTQTTITETTHATGRVHTSEDDSSRWDPFFGFRGSYSLSNRWLIVGSADVGGFGIGDAADFSYQVEANFGYRVSHPVALYAGYRVLGYEIDGDRGGATNVTQYGPKIGAMLVF